MSEPKIKIVGATDLVGARWTLGDAVPYRVVPEGDTFKIEFLSDTVIQKIVRIGSDLEVFAMNTKTNRGIRQALKAPVVTMVWGAVKREFWDDFCRSYPDDSVKYDEVTDVIGRTWKLNEAPPGDDQSTITMIVDNEDRIDVFASPNVGTEWAKIDHALIFTLMPLSIRQAISLSLSPKQWSDLLREANEIAAAEENGEEDEDEEEPEGEFSRQVAEAIKPTGIGTASVNGSASPE